MADTDQEGQAPKRRNTSTPADSVGWTIVGLIFLWVVAMTAWQRGAGGVFSSFLMLYAIGFVVFIVLAVTRALMRFTLPLLAVAFLTLWLAVGGTYSPWRDLLAGLMIVPMVLLAFPESRLWLKRWPARRRAYCRLRRRRERQETSPAAIARRRAQNEDLKKRFSLWVKRTAESARAEFRADKAQPAKPPAKAPVARRLSPVVVTIGGLAVWVGLSLLDQFFAAEPLPRHGGVLRPAAMPPALQNLRVGVALSGGGYRAALVHAGVVDALGQLGVPVTHLSSVSGGSIIGAYLAVGGSPGDFLKAVAAGRFRIARDLLAFQNAVRLPSHFRAPGLDVDLWPFFDEFSRLDVQAALLDRVLLSGATAPSSSPRLGPALMVCMTDLSNGVSVGALNEGYLFVGPTTRRFFRAPDAIDMAGFTRLAERVAVSGSFPGAFPPLRVNARITTVPAPLSGSNEGKELTLVLADGGIRDNLGLRLLEAVDEMAREPGASTPANRWGGFRPPTDWALDLILVSDGGKFLRSEADPGMLAATMRAIDLSGMETGVLRSMRSTSERPLVVLSALSTVAPGPDALIYGITQTARRDAQYEYFRPNMLDQATLAKLVALVPDQAAAQAALNAYRSLPPAHDIKLNDINERCAAHAETSFATADCAWWRLVSVVGEDIWQTAETFMRTPTLSDTFKPGQAEAVFRFGQYLVFLKSLEIQSALTAAARNRALAAHK